MRPLAFSASLRHGPFVRVVSALVPVFLLCPGQGVQASWPPDSPALSLRTQLMVPPATASQRELGSVHGGGSGAHHRIPLSLLGEERSVDYRPEHQAESGGGLVATLSGTPPGEKESSSVPLGRKFTRADTAAEDRQPRTGIQFPRTLAERLQGHAAPGVASWANSLETAGAAELSAKPKLSLGVAKADVFRLSHLHSGLRAVSTLRNPVPVSPRREDFSVHGGRGEVNLLNEGTPFASQQPSPVHISTDSTTEGAGTTFRRRMQDLTSTPGTLNPSAYIDGHLPFHASVLPAVATSYRRYSSSPYFSYQDTTPAVPGPNTPLPLSLFDTKPTKKPTPPLPSGPVAPAEPGFNSEKAESQQVWVVRSSDDSRPSGSFSLVSSVTTPAVPPLPSASPLQPSSLTPAFGSIPESSRPLPNLSSSASQTNREGEGEATTEEAASSDRHQASLARRPAVLPSTSFFNVLFLLLGLFMFAVLAASGGIGGGSVFVALLVGIGHMHLSYAVPISKAMVFCSAFSSFALNRKLERQTAEDVRAVSRAWVDLLVPLALSGSVVGVLLNTVVPPLFLLVILSLLLLSLSVRTILSAARIHQDERAATVQRPFDEIVLTNASFSSHAPPPLSCASSSSSSRPGFPIDSLSPDRDTRTFVACVSHGSTPPSFPSPRGTTPAERRSATPPEPLALSSGDSLFTDSLSPEGAPRRASGTSPLHGPSRPRQEREEEEQSVSAGEQDSATSADANPAPVSDPPGDEAGDAEIEEGTQLAKQGGQEDGAALTRKEGQGGRVRGSGDFAAVSACDYVVDQGGRMGAGVEASDKGTVEEEVASQRCGSEPTPQKEAPCPFSPSTGSPKAEQVPGHEKEQGTGSGGGGIRVSPPLRSADTFQGYPPAIARPAAGRFHDHPSFPRFYSLEDEEDLVHISSFISSQTEVSVYHQPDPCPCAAADPGLATGSRNAQMFSACTNHLAGRNPFTKALRFFASACRTRVSSGVGGRDRQEGLLYGQANENDRFRLDSEFAPNVDVASLLPSSILMDRVDLENIIPFSGVDTSSPRPFSSPARCGAEPAGGPSSDSTSAPVGAGQNRRGASSTGRAVQPSGPRGAPAQESSGAVSLPGIGASASCSMRSQILQASWVAKARKILSDTDALCFDTSAQSSPHYFVLSLLLIVNVFSSSVLHLLLGHGMRTRAWAAAVTAVLVGVAVQLRLSILLCRERQAESPLRFPRRPRLSDFHNLSVRFRKRLWRLFCAAGHYAKTAAEATFLWLQVRVDSLPSTTGISGASRSTLLRRRGSSSQQERLASIEIAPVTGWCSRMRQDEGGFPLCPDSAGKPRELREVSREMSNGVGDHIVLLRDPKSYPGHPASVHCGTEGQNVDMRATGSLGLSCSASPLGAWVSLLFLGYESLPPLLLTPLVGFFTGVFAGLVGVGGGVVFSPFLLFMGTDPVSSVATASACVVFTSASTSLQFLLIGRLPLFFGCLFGLVAGSAAAVATCGIHKLRRAVGGQMSIIAGCVAAAVTLASALTVWRCVEVWLQAGEEG